MSLKCRSSSYSSSLVRRGLKVAGNGVWEELRTERAEFRLRWEWEREWEREHRERVRERESTEGVDNGGRSGVYIVELMEVAVGPLRREPLEPALRREPFCSAVACGLWSCCGVWQCRVQCAGPLTECSVQATGYRWTNGSTVNRGSAVPRLTAVPRFHGSNRGSAVQRFRGSTVYL